MDSKVFAFELQDDKTVKKQSVTLTFPRPSHARLYIITNQRSKCHLLRNPVEQQRFQKTPGIGKTSEEKKLFQYGVSTKVFSVSDPTGTKWEVRLLLSPSEIARLSSACNLIGYLSTHLACRESRWPFEELDGKKGSEAAEEIFRGIAPFLCLPLENDKVEDFCTQIRKIVNEGCKDVCGEEAVMVAGGLAALVAADLAASMVGSDMFDYTGEKTKSQENQNDQIHQMVAAFDVQAEQLAVKHQEKTVHIIFRNPCPDNWASGGRKCAQERGETFEFGLCHKIFSICDAHSEIQFLQSLHESYDMVAVFHLAAFAERLLMTKKWRKTLDILLKEGRKETINELSQLAAEFVCSNKCDSKTFQKCFEKEMSEKWSKVKTLQGGEEVICVFGVLVTIKAALKAKSIADNPNDYLDLSSEEDAEQPVAPGDREHEVDPDCKNIGLPKTEESGYPKPQTIGPNLEENDNVVNKEEATGNIGGIMRGVADGIGDEDIKGSDSLENLDTGTSPPYPEDVLDPRDGDNQVSIGIIETSGTLEPSAVEPQDLDNTANVDNSTYPSSFEESYVHDTESRSGATYNEETIAKTTPSRPTLTLESSYTDTEKTTNHNIPQEPSYGVLPTVEPQGLAKITPKVVEPVNYKDDRSRATYDEDTTLSRPTSDLESSCTNLQETANQDTPKKDGSGGESLTFDSQNDPSNQMVQKAKELEVDQVGQRQDHPSTIDLWTLLIFIIVALAIESYVLPFRPTTVMFTILALVVGVYLFLSRRP